MDELQCDDWHEHVPYYDENGEFIGWTASSTPDHPNTPFQVALLIAQARWGPDASVGKPPPRLTQDPVKEEKNDSSC